MAAAYTYLDHNATSPLRPVAFDAMVEALRAGGNPSSVHRTGRAARARIDKARQQVAALVGALPSEVVFTSGGTEANNMALRGPQAVLVSAIEHESVLKAVPDAERHSGRPQRRGRSRGARADACDPSRRWCR